MTEHPELRKGKCCLFIPFKDNNAGKELGEPLFLDGCTTMYHASLQSGKNIPGKVKAQEVHAVLIYNF